MGARAWAGGRGGGHLCARARAGSGQIGAERYNFFTGCPLARTATIVLRGGAEQFIDESERSIHDSVMIVKVCDARVPVGVGGGGDLGACAPSRRTASSPRALSRAAAPRSWRWRAC